MRDSGVLPFSVATLVRRAWNAKSAKEKHDTAYWGWEASVRLAVAADPPSERKALARGSIGSWVQALTLPAVDLAEKSIIDSYLLFSDRLEGGAGRPRSVRARDLLDALPAYRNRVVGHGSTRPNAFYERAASVLLAGLPAAWEHGLFWRRGIRPVYVESVELDPAGVRRARLLDLGGELSRVIDPRGTPGIPEDLLPRRLYLRDGKAFHPLHPWVVFHEEEFQERILFFNGLGRTPRYLDYASGRMLSGKELTQRYPSIKKDVFALFDVAESVEDEPEEPPAGTDRVGDFRLLEKLGEGGMGVVHLARQESLGRRVALKMLPEHLAGDPVAVARFRQEIAALGRCEHPNVVKILVSGRAGPTYYYAMEFVEGVDLARFGRSLSTAPDFDSAVAASVESSRSESEPIEEAAPREGTPPRSMELMRKLAFLFAEAARGAHHLHENGVVHRDLKPGNLMLTLSEPRAVIMDLGLAKVTEATRTITQDRAQILGTLRYLPPEQLQRHLLQVDHRADLYSLGATFYELFTGRPLFDGETEARLIEQILRENPVPPRKANPAIPKDLATILTKATDKDPALRYDSASALVADLEAFLDNRPIAARPPTLLYLLRLAVQRNKALSATVAASLIVLLALLTGYIRTVQKARADAERNERAMAYRLDVTTAANLSAAVEDPPPWLPESETKLRKWSATIHDLLERRDRHRGRLKRAKTAGAGSAETSELEELLARIDQLESKYLPRIRADLEIVTGLRGRSIERERPAWDRTIEDIASDRVRYAGLGRIRPQLGLVPLRKNEAGLWEFWHVASGARPEIDPETGKPVLSPESGIVLVLLPGGPFWMGSPKDEPNRPETEEERLHKVTLRPFFMGKYEVTQGQWVRAMYGNPSQYPPGTERGTQTTTPVNPVENVNLLDCVRYAKRIGLSLATEAQWEYACRAGTRTPFIWGRSVDCLEGKANVRDLTWKRWVRQKEKDVAPWEDGHVIHAPVGAFPANGFGLHDMDGNVCEWTSDGFLRDYPEDSDKPGDGGNPAATDEALRVIRGGAWWLAPRYARSAFRIRNNQRVGNPTIGLRVARRLD